MIPSFGGRHPEGIPLLVSAFQAANIIGGGTLFTFLRHDGVAWNNNTAENAIKRFAYYREGTVGCLTEAGLADYLVLLSIYQTCRYRGVSFLKFLLSRERDVDAFCEHPRRKRRRPLIEVYPSGVTRPNFAPNQEATRKPVFIA
jgi:hypothetical protein